jgi:Tfp pilus assembly major pilin PilA
MKGFMTEDNILKKIQSQLKDAVKFSNSNIAKKQEEGLKQYKRALLTGDSKLKSSVWVSPEVQQRVDFMTASLIKIFDSHESVVEFLPNGPEDEPVARQMNQTVNFVMKTKNSHLSYLHPWLQNGLVTGLGIVTCEFDVQTEESIPRLVKGIPNEQLAQFTQQEEAGQIVIESASKPKTNELGIETRDLKIRTVKRVPTFNILSVAPEDFIVSKDAKFSEEGGISAKLQGHKKFLGKSTLISMGFDEAKVKSIPLASDKNEGIALERSRDLDGSQGVSGDDVEVYCVFAKLTLDDKKARHYRIVLAGDLDSPTLLDYDECSRFYPYACFVPFPIADTLFGLGIPDKIGDDFALHSKMNRALIDNLHRHVNPQMIVNESTTNMDDVLNRTVGSVIRSDDPTGGISYNVAPFVGADAVPVIDRLSASMDYTTGVGPQMMALNASDLQNTTATAASQRANSSQLLVEMVSRIFADTGYKYLTKIVVQALIDKPEEAQELVSRLTNQFVPIDQFQPEFDVGTSVGFSVMSRDQSTSSLMNLLGQQTQLMGGPTQIVSPQNIYSTLVKLFEAQGFKNTAMFLTNPASLPPPPPNPPPPPTEAEITAQSYRLQAELKAQQDEAQRQFEMQKFVYEMDLKRDQMAQDFALRDAEITAKYNAQIDTARLKLEQSMPRDPTGNITMQQQPYPVMQPEQQVQQPQQMQPEPQQMAPQPEQMAAPQPEQMMQQQPNPMEYPQ